MDMSNLQMDPVLQTHIGTAFEEMQFVRSPERITSGRTASCEQNPTVEQGKNDHEGAVADEALGTDLNPHSWFFCAAPREDTEKDGWCGGSCL